MPSRPTPGPLRRRYVATRAVPRPFCDSRICPPSRQHTLPGLAHERAPNSLSSRCRHVAPPSSTERPSSGCMWRASISRRFARGASASRRVPNRSSLLGHGVPGAPGASYFCPRCSMLRLIACSEKLQQFQRIGRPGQHPHSFSDSAGARQQEQALRLGTLLSTQQSWPKVPLFV